MFSVYCPRHGSDVLLSESRINGLDNSPGDITVRWTCYCGDAAVAVGEAGLTERLGPPGRAHGLTVDGGDLVAAHPPVTDPGSERQWPVGARVGGGEGPQRPAAALD